MKGARKLHPGQQQGIKVGGERQIYGLPGGTKEKGKGKSLKANFSPVGKKGTGR